MKKTNAIIRDELKKKNVQQYELAKRMGYSHCWFCVKMREEFDDDMTLRALRAIDDIAEERRRETMTECEYCQEGKYGHAIMVARNCLNEKLELSIHLHASERCLILAGFKGNDCDASIEEHATINYCPMCGRKL